MQGSCHFIKITKFYRVHLYRVFASVRDGSHQILSWVHAPLRIWFRAKALLENNLGNSQFSANHRRLHDESLWSERDPGLVSDWRCLWWIWKSRQQQAIMASSGDKPNGEVRNGPSWTLRYLPVLLSYSIIYCSFHSFVYSAKSVQSPFQLRTPTCLFQ